MLFKSILRLILSKEHLTNKGLLKILRLKASLNNGLPERLKAYFPGIEPVSRPSIPSIQIKDPAFKSSMNLGLSDELKRDFPSVISSIVPIIDNNKIFSPEWIAGFVSGEGSFIIKISKSRNSKLGVGVQLVFQITQHLRDEKLMKNFILYFGCGRLVKFDQKVNFIVTKFSDIIEKIIPFFNKYPIVGVKALNYNDWCEVALIIKNKGHLTKKTRGFWLW